MVMRRYNATERDPAKLVMVSQSELKRGLLLCRIFMLVTAAPEHTWRRVVINTNTIRLNPPFLPRQI